MKKEDEIRQILYKQLKHSENEIEKLCHYENGLPDVKEENKSLHMMHCCIKEEIDSLTHKMGLTVQCCSCGEIISLLDDHEKKKGTDDSFMHKSCFDSEFEYELGA